MLDAPIRIKRELEAIADPAYRAFQAKLVPTVDGARILGVCTPVFARMPKGSSASAQRTFALIKQPCAMPPLFERMPIALDAWAHNETLQKARESRRISPEQKTYLQSLKA